jgi:hypothetical protein
MSKPFDYSKWDRLEISDDEKDAHPNIDSSLMIRIKREQRARREAEEQMKMAQLRKVGTPDALQQVEEIQRKSKLHVDNICRVVDEKTIVKSSEPVPVTSSSSSASNSRNQPANEQSEEDEFEEFVEKNEELLMEFASMSSFEETEKFLLDHRNLLSDHACGWLLLHQLTLEMAGERQAMMNSTRQYLMLRNIIDLSVEAKKPEDARPMVPLFFKQVKADPDRARMLDEETSKFASQIIKRAIQKKQEMQQQ